MNTHMPTATYPQIPFGAPGSRALTTKKDLALRYAISQRCVDNWVYKRLIPSVKVGRSIRFDVAACDAALKRFERKEVA